MEVTDADGIRVSPCDAQDLGRGPWTDARNGQQGALRVSRSRCSLDSFGLAGNHAQHVRPPAFHTHGVQAEVRECRQHRCSRLKPEASRPGCGLSMPVDQRAEGLARLDAGHLLLEDRGHQRVQQPPRPREP